MKVVMTVLLLALGASTASAKCGNMMSGRMFDDTGVKTRVERPDRGAPTQDRGNMETRSNRGQNRGG